MFRNRIYTVMRKMKERKKKSEICPENMNARKQSKKKK